MLAMQQQLSKRFFILLSLPATAMGFALSVQISALSWILTTQYQLDIYQVGLVWAAGPIAGILGQVIIGIISDNVWFWRGRRRPFILIGGTLAALMLLALPNIGVISAKMEVEAILGIAIAVALTLDLAINVSFNPTRALIADVTPTGEKRTQGYTWMQTISGSFGVLAYAIGAYFGNMVLIYFSVGLVALLSIVPPLLIQEPRQLASDTTAETEQRSNKGDYGVVRIALLLQPLWGFILYNIYAMGRQIAGVTPEHYWAEIAALALTIVLLWHTLRQREQDLSPQQAGIVGFKKLLAAHAFSWVGVQTMFVYMFAFLQQQMPAMTDDELGKLIPLCFLVLSAVAAILPALVLEPLAARFGRVKTHAYCLTSMALAYFALIWFGANQYLLFALMAALGIGWAAIISLPFAIMSEKVQQDRMGLFMGLFNLSVVLPQLIVSLAIGLFISQAEDKTIVFQISSVALAISAFAWFLVDEQPVAQSADQSLQENKSC